MTSAESKTRPAHVPEENVYESIHWMMVFTYFSAAASIAVLLINAG